MSDPKRLLVSDDASSDLKALLREADPPSALPKAVRRRVLGRVSRLAPAFTIFGLSLKAAATTFAASAVVSSVTIVGVREWQQHVAREREAASAHDKATGNTSGRSGLPVTRQAPSPSAVPPQAPSPAEAPAAPAAPAPATKGFELLPPEQAPASPTANVPATSSRLPAKASPVQGSPQTGKPGVSALGVSTEPEAPRDRLARETALLERARRSLGSAPAEALAAAHQHAQEFPGGQLRAERMFIEAQALKNLGRTDEARQQAHRALRQYPNGLYAERVRKFLAELP